MAASNDRQLVKDPHLPWLGDFPYDRLNAALALLGRPLVGPSSTAREVLDVSFHLMESGRPVAAAERAAWDELRLVERRLLADFFLYEAAPLPDGALDAERWALPVPVEMPDLLLLAADPPDLAAIAAPAGFDPCPAPAPLPLTSMTPPPLDLGELAPSLDAFLGEEP